MKNGRWLWKIGWLPAFWSFVVLFATGCGLTKSYVQVDYRPAGSGQKVSGAEAVRVKVEVADRRAVRDHIGRKGSEYSFLGPVISKNNAVALLVEAIETELVRRGFSMQDGAVRVVVELSKFYADYQTGLFSEKIIGEVIMEVQVRSGNGKILFAKMIRGQGSEPGNLVRTGQDTKLAVEKAIQDAVPKLVDDPAFIEALFKAAQTGEEPTQSGVISTIHNSTTKTTTDARRNSISEGVVLAPPPEGA